MPHTACGDGLGLRKPQLEASLGLPSTKQDERGTRTASLGNNLQVTKELYAGAGGADSQCHLETGVPCAGR